MSFNLMKVILKILIDSKNYEIYFCKFRKINDSYQLYQIVTYKKQKTFKIKISIKKIEINVKMSTYYVVG